MIRLSEIYSQSRHACCPQHAYRIPQPYRMVPDKIITSEKVVYLYPTRSRNHVFHFPMHGAGERPGRRESASRQSVRSSAGGGFFDFRPPRTILAINRRSSIIANSSCSSSRGYLDLQFLSHGIAERQQFSISAHTNSRLITFAVCARRRVSWRPRTTGYLTKILQHTRRTACNATMRICCWCCCCCC